MPKASKAIAKANTESKDSPPLPLPTPVVQEYTTDWQGAILPNAVVSRTLIPGCHVRLVVQSRAPIEPPQTTPYAEAIYFRITKIKDGTFWGTSLDTYRTEDWVGIPFDAEVELKWRREHINEIPLEGFGEMRQPKQWVKAVEKVLLEKKEKRGFGITGLRGVG